MKGGAIGAGRYPLIPHASVSDSALHSMVVDLAITAERELRLRYELHGRIDSIRWPPTATPCRADHLWRHTCFELFAGDTAATAYDEYNCSPSTGWAAYRFAAYRENICALDTHASPLIVQQRNAREYVCEVTMPLAIGGALRAGGRLAIGLAAVLEAVDGTQSFWALKHAVATPDFHHRGGWAAELTC
jgi:hypothetical protein